MPSCCRFCGTTEPGWKVGLLKPAEGVCGLRPPFWRPGWKGELAALKSKCEGLAEVFVGLYRAEGLRWLEAGWEKMASAWPGCH